MINETIKKDSLTRLRRIEGQVRGIMRMVDKGEYCIDIINQITAVQKALDGVSKNVMKRHVESCVSEAIRRNGGEKMINELIQTVFKYKSKGTR
jgi:CsoR family transcriptional regulator, copper-sensing transcriptional repressor